MVCQTKLTTCPNGYSGLYVGGSALSKSPEKMDRMIGFVPSLGLA